MRPNLTRESMWSAFNMPVKILLFTLLWSVGEIVLSAANPVKDGCRQPFQETVTQNPSGPVTLCCKPIETFSCAPGHEVVACQMNHASDECRPCTPGLTQNQYSDSKNIRPCRHPNPCTEEAELVEVEGTWQCQCNSSQGYCGHEQDCLKVDKICPDGFKLHHRHCNCTAETTEIPTALSKSTTTTTPGLTTELLKTTGSLRNGASGKENATTTPSSLGRTGGSEPSADSHSADNGKDVLGSNRTVGSMTAAPPHSVDEEEVLKFNSNTPGNSDTNLTAIIAVSTCAVIVFFLMVIGIMWIRGNNNTLVANFCCNVWRPAAGSEGLGRQNEDNNAPLVTESDSHSSVSEGNPETVVPVEEERMAVSEEGSSEAGPDQTHRKDSYIEINSRVSTDMVMDDNQNM